MLNANAARRRSTRETVATSPLAGRIFDADGQVMSPTFAYGKAGRLYRYYVSAPLQQGGRSSSTDDAPRRVSAPRLESTLIKALARLLQACPDNPLDLISRLELRSGQVVLFLAVTHLADIRERLKTGETADADPADRTLCRIVLPLRFALRGGRTEVVGGAPGAAHRDPVLIRALREARGMIGTDRNGDPVLDASPVTPHRRRLVRLAFLAPDIQRAILAGKQPHGLSLARLLECELPLAWADQKRILGFHRETNVTC